LKKLQLCPETSRFIILAAQKTAKTKTYTKLQNYNGIAISFSLREISGRRSMLTNMAENSMLREGKPRISTLSNKEDTLVIRATSDL
jgi:hypothetical protein